VRRGEMARFMRSVVGSIFLIMFVIISIAGTLHSEGTTQKAKGSSPLIEEMEILDGVFREVVSAVSLGDGMAVHKALESMHGTMEKTHEGVSEGTVQLHKNAHMLEEFIQMDKEFHQKLEKLAHAAHENNQEEMLSLTKSLLDDCVRCHQGFRE
jgi:hypothetical protein